MHVVPGRAASLGRRLTWRCAKVRLMAPFNMRCLRCREYIYQGTKFNARKEYAAGEDYLGIKRFRFYIRCPHCTSEITFKTDPQNTDYVTENGIVRVADPFWSPQVAAERAAAVAQSDDGADEPEASNPMKALESRTVDSKREMDLLDALEEIKDQNARHERVDFDRIIAMHTRETAEDLLGDERQAAERDRDLARAVFSGRSADAAADEAAGSGAGVKRLNSSDEEDLEAGGERLLRRSRIVANTAADALATAAEAGAQVPALRAAGAVRRPLLVRPKRAAAASVAPKTAGLDAIGEYASDTSGNSS